MELENVMAMLERNCSFDGDQEDIRNIGEGDEQTSQVNSLLRLIKISNEFAAIKDSMEMFPLPGNKVQPQRAADALRLGPQDLGQGIRATDLLMSLSVSEETTKHKIKELAENAMDEVTKLFIEGEPLWQHDMERGFGVLNNGEYVRRFSSNLDSTLDDIIRIISLDAPLDLPGLEGTNDIDYKPSTQNATDVTVPRLEPTNGHQATREIGYIQMSAIGVVDILMDVRLWSFVFSEMLSRAAVLDIISPGAPGTQDGALHLMTAEYHAPSALLSTRQSCFARYCKEVSENMWAIVDISLESMIDNPLMNCKRRPSGCLIQGLPDGNSQITWIEHTEAKMESIPPLFKAAVTSGLVFSAKRWVDTLSRQCHNLNLILQQSLGHLHKEVSPFNIESLLRLAERMRRGFHGATSATKDNKYKPIPIKGGDDILFKTVDGDAQNPTLITVTTSSWLPFTHKKVFSFLGDDRNRIKWDLLALERVSQEVFRFNNGQGPEDIVSITKMVDEEGSIDTLFLQEKQENAIASYIVFSPITYKSLVSISNQGNIDEVPLLPSGFAILSDKSPAQQRAESLGCILTLSFQLLDSSSKTAEVPKKTFRKLYNLVKDTITKIRVALFEPPTRTNQDDAEGCSYVHREKRLKKTDHEASTTINGIVSL